MNISIFFLILVLMLLSLILNKIFDKENFKGNTQSKSSLTAYNNNINSIILDNNLKGNNFYIGSFIKSDENQDKNLSKYIFQTTSLQSNNWDMYDTININNQQIVIVDLSYDIKQKLMAVGLHFNSEQKPEYHIYRKSSSDLNSSWEKITNNPNIQIQCLCYDIDNYSNNNPNLLAVNKEDGQIYENISEFNFDEWIGPINFDTPVSKIMYDKYQHLIGIGRDDGFIYKKKDTDWRNKNNKWEYVNKTQVYDLIYDIDGCFIATTPYGIKKQRFPDFFSSFTDITKKRKTNYEQILNKEDILNYKIGFEFSIKDPPLTVSNQIDSEVYQYNLEKYFQRIYQNKKRLQNLCITRRKDKKYKINKDLSHNLAKSNEDVQQLFSLINNTINKFK